MNKMIEVMEMKNLHDTWVVKRRVKIRNVLLDVWWKGKIKEYLDGMDTSLEWRATECLIQDGVIPKGNGLIE